MAQTSAESERSYPGWRVVAVCFATAAYAWGFAFYGHGFYLAELTAAHGWPASVVAGATTAFYLFSAVIGAFTGEAIARFGARVVVVSGVCFTAIAASLLPTINEVWQLYAVYALMAFGWAATSLTAITTIIGMWFTAKRGLAISIALTGASFGGIIVVPLLALISTRGGFAPAIWFVAAGFGIFVAALAFMWLGKAPLSRVSPFAPNAIAESKPVGRAVFLRSRAFWSISAPFALAFFAQVGFLVHQITILEPTVGRETAGLAVALTTAAAVGGRLALGSVVDRLNQRLVTGASFASQAMALIAVWLARDPLILVAACMVFGFSVGNIITLPALIIGREFALDRFATVVGLSNAVCQIAYSLGPGVLGALRDTSGGYGLPLALCAALDLAAGVAIVAGQGTRVRA